MDTSRKEKDILAIFNSKFGKTLLRSGKASN